MNRKTRRGNNPANPSDGLMKQFLFMTGVVTVMIVLIIAGVVTLVAALKVLVPALEPAETRDIVDVLEELRYELNSGDTFIRTEEPPVSLEEILSGGDIAVLFGRDAIFSVGDREVGIRIESWVTPDGRVVLDLLVGIMNGEVIQIETTEDDLRRVLKELSQGQMPPELRDALTKLGVDPDEIDPSDILSQWKVEVKENK